MDQGQISARLQTAINRAISAQDVQLGDGNQTRLPEMADQVAAAILQITSSDEQQELETRRGEAAFAELVDTMGEGMSIIPGYNRPGIIGEDTLTFALARLGGRFPPFW